MNTLQRRTFLKLMGGTTAASLLPVARAKSPSAGARASFGDRQLGIEVDGELHTRLSAFGAPLSRNAAAQRLRLAKGEAKFRFAQHKTSDFEDPRHGHGTRHEVMGSSDAGIEQRLSFVFHPRYPGMACVQARYTNTGTKPLAIAGWQNADYAVPNAEGGFWTFSGATHEDRRDWVQPLKPGFDQTNDLGMTASDYGGGIPMANVWRRDVGLAVGHVEVEAKRVRMPVKRIAEGARIGLEGDAAIILKPGESFETPRSFIAVHRGDYFATLAQYREFMTDQGMRAPEAPASAFAPIWCAWGYERHFNTEQIIATLPKAKDIGCEWAVLDDGWQNNEGDWAIDRSKFPRGEADMRKFAASVREHGMRPRLWIAPLAVDPGSDLLHEHSDMLLLDEWGSVNKVSWWNAFTLCPAYKPVVDYHVALTKKIIGEWGYEGLKLDGQHLNAVAPCYNPAHNHTSPEDSCEAVADFWKAIYDAAREANPNAVVELCPCGTVFAAQNIPYTNQVPSSDPLSSWQVRTKGKTLKALMGRGGSYAGDHVELSDNRDDFASSYGIGAVLSTKFTWPKDTDKPLAPLPPGGYVLTEEKEKIWRKWMDLYREQMLPKGEYLGGLYDIGFDKPEAHVVSKGDVLHFAFYADEWNGALKLKGLKRGSYRLRDAFTGRDLGTISGSHNTLRASFKRFLLVQATPTGDAA